MPTKQKKPATLPFKLASKLPKDPKVNGLVGVHEQLRRFGTATIIMTVGCDQVVKTRGGEQPIMVIEHIEGLTGDLADEGEILLDRARVARESDDGVLPGMDTGSLTREQPYEPVCSPRADDPEY